MFEVDFAKPNFCIGGSSEPIGRVKRGARTPIGMRVNEKIKNLKNSTKQNNYQIIKTKQQAGADLCQAHDKLGLAMLDLLSNKLSLSSLC